MPQFETLWPVFVVYVLQVEPVCRGQPAQRHGQRYGAAVKSHTHKRARATHDRAQSARPSGRVAVSSLGRGYKLKAASLTKRLTIILTALLHLQPKDFTIKMNKKERRLALSTALQSAADAITVVDDLHVRKLLLLCASLANRESL